MTAQPVILDLSSINKHVPNYKVAQKIITKMRSLKITKLRNIITKLRRNYKVAQKLQSCAEQESIIFVFLTAEYMC